MDSKRNIAIDDGIIKSPILANNHKITNNHKRKKVFEKSPVFWTFYGNDSSVNALLTQNIFNIFVLNVVV